MERNPLECVSCDKELSSAVLLSCHHSICGECVERLTTTDNSTKHVRCPLCDCVTPSTSTVEDRLAMFLVDTAHEETELCANCEQVVQPMFYCETCQQTLCSECRTVTHQARMFASHRILAAEERAQVHGEMLCDRHQQPFILFCNDKRKISCIQCFNERPHEERNSFVSIEAGHASCVEKIEALSLQLRQLQNENSEELEVRKRVLAENNVSYEGAKNSIYQTCQQIIDTVLTTRDRLLRELENGKTEAEKLCRQQMAQINALEDPFRLCLLAGQIFCASASKMDVLQLSREYTKRVQSLLSVKIEKLPPCRFTDPVEARSEISKALEPYLGMTAAWCPLNIVRADGSRDGSGSHKSHKARSGSYTSQSCPPMMSKFQVMIDLSGAFGQLFARVEGPMKDVTLELAELSGRVQETQRDLTMRRCLIKADAIQILIKDVSGAETKVGFQSALLNEMQSELQEIWQEQLDRVRRQQIIYREKIEECLSLRETARQVLTAAKQLLPFATCIEQMSGLINPKRCHPPDPAPMESICMQISTIAPNSLNRIQAIEKEEQHRKAVQEAKKREEQEERGTAVKTLKHGKTKRKDAARLLVNTNRERSPGGTDTALLSPCVRRISPVVKEETMSDLEMEGVLWDESFDLSGEDQGEGVNMTLEDEDRCTSSLSLNINATPPCGLLAVPPHPSPSSSIEALSTTSSTSASRIPLAFRVTTDVDSSRQSVLQCLHDVFNAQHAVTESVIIEQSNVSASALKSQQKKMKDDGTLDELQLALIRIDERRGTDETPPPREKPVREVRRRRLRKEDLRQLEESNGGVLVGSCHSRTQSESSVATTASTAVSVVDEAIVPRSSAASPDATFCQNSAITPVEPLNTAAEPSNPPAEPPQTPAEPLHMPAEPPNSPAESSSSTQMTMRSVTSSPSTVPDPPFVPLDALKINANAKLGSFEAKEKVLQSLMKRMSLVLDNEQNE